MELSLSETHDAWRSLPDVWQDAVRAQLQDGETLVAWFESDLDEHRHYAKQLVVLTTSRLLSRRAREASWQSWALSPGLKLQATEQAGLGKLELLDNVARLARWNYTAASSAAVRRFETRWKSLERGDRTRDRAKPGRADVTICPSCGETITSEDGVCPACTPSSLPSPTSSLLRLLAFTKQRMGLIILGVVFTIAAGAAELVPTYLTIPLLDRVLVPRQAGQDVPASLVYLYLTGFFVAALVAWLLNWARQYVTAWLGERVTGDLRMKTYSHLQQLSLEFFGGKRTGDLMARVGTDTERLSIFVSPNLVDFLKDLLMILMTAAVLFSVDPILALATLLPFPLIVWVSYWVREKLRHGFTQSSVAWGQLNSVLADTIPGIRVVKAFAQERREVERFERSNQHLLNVNDRLNRIWSFFSPVVWFLTQVGLLAVWACAAWQVFHDRVTVGVLTAFVSYISRLYSRVESMLRIVPTTQRAAASAQRIFEILDRVPSVPEPVKPVHPKRLKGHIELRDVRFKYGAREVLHGLNLTIEPGELIGLVGPSGAGKSTLINLICRFFDVADGAILVDGTDIRSFPLAEYRQNIGIVLQDPFLFYGSIAENIAYGKPSATRDEIVAAARAAHAHEFILKLADGYDSLVGERGQSLSGGERQRISIARALLIDPRILILDEATSSVDTETEREIQIALENLIRGRTTIAIAHRLSTLRKANRLVVLERGQIVEIGKHADLLATGGAYARLHQAQMELVQGLGVG